jgi:LmbE family N-acetylglucosaminyl deacetylase
VIDKLMIVSHPDDEALFGGAELLTYPDEYKVVVIDEYHSKIRRKEFKASMKFIGIKEYEHWTGHPRHRALHDILNHLRPDILWQFDKGKKRLSNKILVKKRDLLKVYKSQREVLDWFSPWYEKISKVNNNTEVYYYD